MPAPFGPTSATLAPSSISIETSRRASWPFGYVYRTPTASSAGVTAILRPARAGPRRAAGEIEPKISEAMGPVYVIDFQDPPGGDQDLDETTEVSA